MRVFRWPAPLGEIDVPEPLDGGGDELDLVGTVRALMPELRRNLEDFVRIPSVSSLERIDQPILEAFEFTSKLFADAGVEVERLDLPGTAPTVVGQIPAPPGAPTVLLYSHYDVVAPGDESQWHTPPFEPVERDGAIFGRGSADTKSNVLAHVGALRAWGGRPPVGIRICIEGSEEVGSAALDTYPASNPDLFRADALVIGDSGNISPASRRSRSHCGEWPMSRYRCARSSPASTAASTAERLRTRFSR